MTAGAAAFSNEEVREAVLAVVRGKAGWRSLERVGIFVELKDDGCEIDNPWLVVVSITPGDVAEGLLSNLRNHDELSRWARIVMSGASFLDFGDGFETTRSGAVLLDALWDAMEGEVSDEAVEVASGVVRRG